jgi:hypothetical protein
VSAGKRGARTAIRKLLSGKPISVSAYHSSGGMQCTRSPGVQSAQNVSTAAAPNARLTVISARRAARLGSCSGPSSAQMPSSISGSRRARCMAGGWRQAGLCESEGGRQEGARSRGTAGACLCAYAGKQFSVTGRGSAGIGAAVGRTASSISHSHTGLVHSRSGACTAPASRTRVMSGDNRAAAERLRSVQPDAPATV